MKINIIGEGHAYILAEMLDYYGIYADNNAQPYRNYDINLVMGLWYIPKDLKDYVLYLMGSDVWRDIDKLDLTRVDKAHLILYPNRNMLGTKIRSYIHDQTEWHMPVNTTLFFHKNGSMPAHNILCYALDPMTYRLDKIIQKALDEPDRYFTILGSAFQNLLMVEYPNVQTIRSVPYHLMPRMYRHHCEFWLWYNHPGSGGPGVMSYEALLMGLDSYFNDKQVTEIPDYMKMEEAIPRLQQILTSLK